MQMVDDNSHVSVSIRDLDPTWVTCLKQKLLLEPKRLRSSSGSSSCCIYRVPQCLRHGHEDKDYTPQIVSIGPFHRGKESLQAMEEHKLKYLHGVISRNGDDSLEKYLMPIKKLEKRAREFYSETVSLDSNEFVEMMAVDGCFIIELLCTANGIFCVRQNDPIFKLRGVMNKLRNDLLLLENQIPYLVLQCLFDLMNISPDGSVSLAHLALQFFGSSVPMNYRIIEENPDLRGQHLLHLLHSNLLPLTKEEKSKFHLESNPPLKMTPCITELREAGIKFKKGEADSFLDVEFRKGVIRIPHLMIEDCTNSLLPNLIAFEQSYRYCGNHITAYTTFMDCLINSAKDVEVQRHNGVIENWLGSDEEVADLFNRLGREVTVTRSEFYLIDIFEEVHSYHKTSWHVWRASLMHKYFYNPWAILSLLAAIVLLLLTFMQTLFAMLSYFHPSS